MRIARTLRFPSAAVVSALVGAAVVTGVALFAQGRNIGNEWPTALGDAQRTNWMRSDPNISIDALAKPGFELQWKAALYALDGQTGKELWSSGNQIESWNHFSGLTVANGRAYLGTFDGYLYCFGVK